MPTRSSWRRPRFSTVTHAYSVAASLNAATATVASSATPASAKMTSA